MHFSSLLWKDLCLMVPTFWISGNAIFPGAMPGCMPYWNGPPMPHFRPFCNLYGNPVMMPFNATMVPASPFPVPNYLSSTYGPVHAFG